MKKNEKVKDDVFVIKYKYPFNGEKRYGIQKLGSLKLNEILDHDQFIDKLSNDFEHEIVIKVIINTDQCKRFS